MASHEFSKATVEIRNSGGEITATADGWAFFSACGHKLVAHKTMSAGKYWQVTEPVTGYRVGSGATSRAAAADVARAPASHYPRLGVAGVRATSRAAAADVAESILARHPGALAQCITQTLIEREVAAERAA